MLNLGHGLRDDHESRHFILLDPVTIDDAIRVKKHDSNFIFLNNISLDEHVLATFNHEDPFLLGPLDDVLLDLALTAALASSLASRAIGSVVIGQA